MIQTEPDLNSARSLSDWLRWQEHLHPRTIDLGLDRSREVGRGLGLIDTEATTVTVAGTNGKGSSATLTAAIYRAAGYRVGCYTSPHLLRYNERIAIDGKPVSDQALCTAFAAVEARRGAIPLTYFEFGTLAALWLFRQSQVEVQVLEVGLGGRLDAVNIIDADAAILTNVGLDHTDWLGPDRESIGREQCGVFRAGRAAICVDSDPPKIIAELASRLGANLRQVDVDFGYHAESASWRWRGRDTVYERLPPPALNGAMQLRNAAGVLAAIEALQSLRPVAEAAIAQGLRDLHLPGRLQRQADLLLDVAHNIEAAQNLAAYLENHTVRSKRSLVLGMLSDKPVEAVGLVLSPLFERIYAVGLMSDRGLSGAELRARLARVGVVAEACEDVRAGLAAARGQRVGSAPIVVSGSFLTVATALSIV